MISGNDVVLGIKSNTYLAAHTSSDETKAVPPAASSRPTLPYRIYNFVSHDVSLAVGEAAIGVGSFAFSLTSKLFASYPVAYGLLTVSSTGIAGVINGGAKTSELATDQIRKINLENTRNALQESLTCIKDNRLFLKNLKINFNNLLAVVKELQTVMMGELNNSPISDLTKKPLRKPTTQAEHEAARRRASWDQEAKRNREEIAKKWEDFKRITQKEIEDEIKNCGLEETIEEIESKDNKHQIKATKTTDYEYSFGEKCQTAKAGSLSFFNAGSFAYTIAVLCSATPALAAGAGAITGAGWGCKKISDKVKALKKFKDEEHEIKINEQEIKKNRAQEIQDQKERLEISEKQSKLLKAQEHLLAIMKRIKNQKESLKNNSPKAEYKPTAPAVISNPIAIAPHQVTLNVRSFPKPKISNPTESEENGLNMPPIGLSSSGKNLIDSSQTFFAGTSPPVRRKSQLATAVGTKLTPVAHATGAGSQSKQAITRKETR